jgi:hypothetical protein
MIIFFTSFAYSAIFMLFKNKYPKIRVVTSLIQASLLSLYALNVYLNNNTLFISYDDTVLNDEIAGFFLYDLTYGMIVDRPNFDIITGLLHHSVYIVLLRYLRINNISNLIYPFLPFEVPTVLMDIRKINPSTEVDYVFGFSFFTFRILYNFYLIGAFMQTSYVYSSIITLMLGVHTFWFKTWVEKRFAIQNNRIVFLLPNNT